MLPKFRLGGEGTASGPPPIPPICNTCGLPGALSVIARKASSGPTIDGWKPSSNEQDAPDKIGAFMHASVSTRVKSELFGPTIPRFVTLSGEFPVLVTPANNGGMFCEPISCCPNSSLGAVKDKLGAAA